MRGAAAYSLVWATQITAETCWAVSTCVAGELTVIDGMLQSGVFAVKALGFRVRHHDELLVIPAGIGLCSNTFAVMDDARGPPRSGPAGSPLQSERWDSHATMHGLHWVTKAAKTRRSA